MRLFLIPEVPAGKCLKQEHLQSVDDGGSTLLALLEKESLVGIVD